MTVLAISSILPREDVETVEKESSALAALRRAKPALILAQVQAQKGDNEARREQVLAAGRAVRMIEAAAYTEIYADRYRKFAATVLSLPSEVQAAHAKACTCTN